MPGSADSADDDELLATVANVVEHITDRRSVGAMTYEAPGRLRDTRAADPAAAASLINLGTKAPPFALDLTDAPRHPEEPQ